MKSKIILFSAIAIIFLLSYRNMSGKSSRDFNVIPCPKSIEFSSGFFKAAGADFHIAADADELTVKAVSEFAERLSFDSGKESKTNRECPLLI